jgi:hypothetical protein
MSGTTPTPGSGPADENKPAEDNPYAQPSGETPPPAQPAATPPSYQPPADQPPAGQPPAWSGPVGQPDVPQERPEPPKSILNAVRLMYVGAALSLLSLLFTLTDRDAIREELERTGDYTPDEIDSLAGTAIAFAAIIGLLGVALWLWMAAKNKQGRSWARVVATVLAGLNILITVSNLAVAGTAGGTGIGLVVSLVMVVLAAAILWFLYRPESSQYYAAVSRMNR